MSKKKTFTHLERQLIHVAVVSLVTVVVASLNHNAARRANDAVNAHKRRKDDYIPYEDVK